jgi:hypothetical protein
MSTSEVRQLTRCEVARLSQNGKGVLYFAAMTEPFPEGCPPPAASPIPGTFYRLADKKHGVGAATGPSSWLRPYETHGSPYYKQVEDPEAHGLSLYAQLDELERARDIATWLGKKSVAEVTIGHDDGDLRHSPIDGGASHFDWWTSPYDLQPSAVVVAASRQAVA